MTLRRRRGFTLLELMIVIVIIAILSMVLIPYMAKQRYQAQLSNCESNERALAAALENYHTREGDYPSSLTASFLDAYMAKGNVVCPTNKNAYVLSLTPQGDSYTISCQGLHHLGLPGIINPNFPQFSPSSGLSRR